MTSDEFKELEEAFQNALSLEGAERDAFLEKLDRDRRDLAKRVRELLKADATGDTIAAPIAASVKALKEDGDDPWIGKTIGDWRLHKRLGAGGMGAVFLADRADEQYAQTAALKIMGAQLLDQNAAARFRAERQILANLNHPNIATLIDGGSTDDGLPYLVMEYVDGVRIDDYCDINNLVISNRLFLFQKLCAAVDYAHRNLVVHRDLKPSNMLVTENGDPKLLDFGIAKLLETDDYELTMARTGEGARIMTPEYASPEQVRGEPVSVATDVYALGVLLFRLLTGHSPYGPSATTPREIESAILEAEPKKPSASITEYSSTDDKTLSLDDLSEKRSVSPEHLRKTLSGDLDTIILKCLQKEPERRYATARELAADIERHLNNRPILARADSWTYKTKKFLTRNARPTAAAAAMFVAIVSLVAFYTLRLADERDKAQLAAAEAEQVAGFLTNIFRNADPHTAQGTPATAVDLLRSAETRISDLDAQPMLQARLTQIIGDTYANLGETSKAIELLEWSQEMRRASLAEDPLAYGMLLQDLAEAYRLSGDLDAAEKAMRECIIKFEEVLLADDPQILFLRGRLAVIFSDQSRKVEALETLQGALRKRLQSGSQHDSESLDMFGNTAHLLVDLGRYSEAEEVHAEVIRLSKEIDGPLHPSTLIRTNNMALLRRAQFQLKDAKRLHDEATSGAQKIWPEGHPYIARWTAGRAYIKALLGEFDEAFAEFPGAVEQLRQIRGETSNIHLSRLRFYGEALAMAGRLDEASAKMENAITVAVADDRMHASATNVLRVRLALVKNLQNRPDEALALLDLAASTSEWQSTRRSADMNATRAVSLSLLERSNEATALFETLIAGRSVLFGPESAAMIQLYTDAASHFRRSDKIVRAENYARRAHEIGQLNLPAGNWIAALATAEYAYVLAASGKTGEAEKFATRAYDDLIATFGPDDYRAIPLKELIDSF
ncbi:protein kinase domain-containing protein [Hyphococcus lacteus]|uniref:Serine/threonine-protein kinase n=1 Tax=Hyphococcus lacteus TaxID=3143536 RepID=A0ABV3ZBM4_9PROT